MMVDFVVFFVIFGISTISAAPTPAATGNTSTPSSPPSLHQHSCSLSNLHELQSIENIIFYSVTWDCHLYAWRDGLAPTLKDVGLNGTEPMIIHDSKTKADKLGSFVRSHGLTKRCRPEDGTIVFMDRQDQQIPQLVIMVRYSEKYYSIIRLNIEELLATKPFISQSLLEQLDESETPVYTGPVNPKSCIFVKKDLHCFSLTNDHVIKQTIYRLGKSEGKTVYGEYSSKNHTLSKLRIIEPIMAATWDGKGNDSSVYVYDKISDGWLYKFNGDESSADGTRKQTMHKFPTTHNMLKNLWTIDKQLLIVSKCSTLQCQFFWVQIRPSSHSPFTCLFTSPINLITGVLTDIRLQPLAPELPEQQALSAGWLLPDAKNSYWPLIVLATICLLIVGIILIGGFIYESVGFKRRYLIEKAVDEQYSNIFWKDNGEEIGCTISDFPSYIEPLPPPSPPKEDKKLPAEEESFNLLTTVATPELPKSPKKSRMLFLEEDNKTPESIKKSIKQKETKKSSKSANNKPPSEDPPPKEKPPSKNQKGEYKEIKMSTHKPKPLNPRKKRRRTRRIPIPESDAQISEKLPKDNKDDVIGSIKVKANSTKFEPLPSGEFTPDTIKSKKEKERRRKSKSRKSKSRSTKK